MLVHSLLRGKVRLYKRENSSYWQCSTFLDGKEHRKSTKEDSLPHAKQVAEDWYLELRGKSRAGLLKTEKTFREAAEEFTLEYGVITEGQRSPLWVKGHQIRLRLHLLPFFGDFGLSEITPGKMQQYRVHRISTSTTGKPPARSTLHDEVVTLRLVLKTALRYGWIEFIPDFSPPYKTQGKISHRPWFSPEEYKQLYQATGEYARNPVNSFHRWNAEQVHDFVLFLANTGLRPDEAKNLEHRDVSIVKDQDTGQRILEIEVRGKRGVGYCKSMPGAVRPYQRLLARPLPGLPQGKRARRRRGETDDAPTTEVLKYPQPMDRVFPGNQIKLFNGVLKRAGLKKDRDGNARTAYSLRHTYICMRLMDKADIYQLAKNCRTSVEMIEKFYAAHIKNTLDASAINTRRPKRSPKDKTPTQ
jgi:integrase